MRVLHLFLLQQVGCRYPQTWSSRGYYTELQRQAEERQKARSQLRQTERRLDPKHTGESWGPGRELPGRTARARFDEEASRKKDYCNELQKMITERSEAQRRFKEEAIAEEKQVSLSLPQPLVQHTSRPTDSRPTPSHSIL